MYGNLPICPICRDTKHVFEEPCIKLTPGCISYNCEACKISWDTIRYPYKDMNDRRGYD